jgi:hypothetical protein
MVMRERVMEGYIYVDPLALAGRAAVQPWVRLALAFVRTLPPKQAAKKKAGAAKSSPKSSSAKRT